MSRRGSPFFGVVMGFALGALVAILVVPSRTEEASTDVVAGRGVVDDGGLGTATTLADDAVGVPGGAGDAGTGAVAGRRGGGGTGAGTAGGSVGSGDAGGTSPTETAATGPVRGVTDDAVTIGIALLDLGALRNLGPAFDNGDRRAHFESILAAWKREGLVPVHGRQVRFVYRSYGPINPEEQRAACRGLVQDEDVFMVLGDSQFQSGIDCVSREFGTPIVTSDAPTDESVFQRGHPNVFTLQMSTWRMVRNQVHWAHRNGFLAGKQIGVYRFNEPFQRELVDKALKPELAKLGYSVTAEHATDQQLGGPQDAIAVQRFQATGVDVVFLYTSKAGFMQQAQAQGYRPRYLESDFLSGTTNTATSTYPPAQFDGTFGISGMRFGEWKAGLPAPPEAEACLSAYEQASGRRIDPNAREAEYVALTKACDGTRLVIHALQTAGRGLTPQAVVAALEQVRGAPMAIHGAVTYGPGKHHGTDVQRTVQWTAGCRCWKALGSFEPLFVP